MTVMNIIVVGAGAVGGYFGGKIAKHGFPVTFLVRQKRYEELQEKGLIIKSVHGDFSLKPTLALDVNEIEKPDLVIVAIKNYHLDEAFPQLKALVDKGAKILPLLNGIKHLEKFIDEFGEKNVIGGLCSIETTLNSHGEIVQTSRLQDIVFGPIASIGEEALLFEFKQILESSSIPHTLSDYIIGEMWKKFIFITTLSGITATLRQPIGVALADQVTLDFVKSLISEVCQIAKVKGIRLPENIDELTLTRIKSLSPKMTASMHRDLEKGLPLELDDLQGYALTVAKEYQLETPCLQSVYALLHPYKNGRITQ